MKNFYQKKEFLSILKHEQALAARTSREFSVVIFDIHKKIMSNENLSCFYNTLFKRFRCTDEIGWLDKNRLGIIMPETSADNAHLPINDLHKALPSHKRLPPCSIYTYPSNWMWCINGQTCFSNDHKYPQQIKVIATDKHTDIANPTYFSAIPFWKRIIDILAACTGLLLISPLMLLVALYIKIISPGPVFFKQVRVGYMGNSFICWKFRTMQNNADASQHYTHLRDLIHNNSPLKKLDSDDPRIIPLGKLMRLIGIDELPQLFNVIRGEMSLIGPRPCIPYEAQQYHPWHCKRFETLPGMTGLWQVNGKNTTTFNEMIRYDINYILRRSLLLDFKILLKTPLSIISQIFKKRNIQKI